jgi:hypothetical protein
MAIARSMLVATPITTAEADGIAVVVATTSHALAPMDTMARSAELITTKAYHAYPTDTVAPM